MSKKIRIQPRTYEKRAQIKIKIIDEAKKAAKQQVVAYTPVVFNPELNSPSNAETESGKKMKTYKRIVKEAMLGEDAETAIASKTAGKLAGRVGSKLIPGLGLAYSGADAISRIKSGDYTGAAISGASGVASLVPGIGTAASLGLDAYNIKRDYDADRDSNIVSKASAEPAPQNSPAKPAQTTPPASNTPAAKPTQVTPKPVAPAPKPVQTQQAPKPATPVAKPVSSTPAPSPSNDYKIQKGDTLSTISKRSGVSVDQLAKDNNIKDVNKIYSGSNLKINKPSGVK